MNIETAYETLKDAGYIEFGKVIPAKLIEDVLGVSFAHGDWEFMGKFLQLKELIEEQGFFCTSRGAGNGALRIQHPAEWQHRMENLQKTVIRKQKKAITTVSNAELSEISESERATLAHELNKLSMGLQAMRSVLYDL